MRFLKVFHYTVASAMGCMFLVGLLWVGPRYAVAMGNRWGWPLWQHPMGIFLGGVLVAVGLGVFLYCTGLFTVRGRGTPVPVAPPSTLVATGLYHHTRNPIYLAYVAVMVGEAVFVGSALLFVYAIAMFLLLHVMVVAHEEPVLQRRFGADYGRYQRSVPRWLAIFAFRKSSV